MDPATRNSVVGGAVVAAAIVAAVALTPASMKLPQKIYPRLMRPRNISDAAWAARMESYAKTNVPGTTMYIKIQK